MKYWTLSLDLPSTAESVDRLTRVEEGTQLFAFGQDVFLDTAREGSSGIDSHRESYVASASHLASLMSAASGLCMSRAVGPNIRLPHRVV